MIEINGKKIWFPLRYSPTQYQIDSLNFIKKSINTGKRFMLNNSPTGTGKSYLVILFATWYRNFVDDKAKFDILTNSKVLQDQYLRDFNFIQNYKGLSNYYCQPYDTDCKNGKELCKILKAPCNSCPYDIAKNKWLNSDIGLTNFHLFTTLSLFQKDTLSRRDSNVLIVDECHLLESVFSDYLNTKVSAKTLKKCGFGLKEIETLDDRFISKIKKLDKYLEFLEKKLIPMLESKLSQFETEIKSSSIKKRTELTNYINNIESKLLSFKNLFESHKRNPDNIVLDIIENKKDKMYSGIELLSQHIWINDYLNELVWKNYDHIIFMSGTILNPTVFSYLNGLDPDLTSYYEKESPFPVKNRPIYYLKVGKMNMANKEETFQKQIYWINNILKKYKDKKGIIHCVTYEIADWVKENIQNKRLLFHDTENRDEILEKHLSSKEPTVIVSPSMSSGLDLKDDSARFAIILKIPYPNLGSKKIQARQKTNPDWYKLNTVQELTQMYGRTVRSEDDQSDTFILDSNFSDLMKYSYDIIPKYLTDAVKVLKI
jgi:Rad3-related DNA helicase